ncbi:leucine zipper protein 1-like [Sinocyclocheilus anshuiensis]|uniref:Leucine zipper protein 1-like n=1 Tax=Sinocyclocheilus anshuiensis TaxID=1608454 RepID=A0A671S4P3_9TELE|nr:PREDICTED: leucine zipper protein 1-like [Sinocyclocheilus anshuiensis]XP_016350101.1 PREDICTED: leucine zipper protein 1-like [Sinocyclocheilus anshuiensis]XP_016350107.1 PREDICTED: leucine zipper protein 1-like [Sinocyclocheilus anshuiensis]
MTDTTNRHLRHKLQNLGRRLDELEEARGKLQKAEDELLDIQDKIIQAEGSNSSLLTDVETMRKRLLKIEGKDEEVRKAEDLCRKVREKLDQEEKLTKDLKVEIERLQRRMTELEKLEEAFGKSKSDCRQLCISLNEEKNLTKKLAAELDALKARVKEVDTSEARLDRAEKSLTAEMEKLKSLTQTFVTERKRLLERQREDEKIILKLTEKLELKKSKLGPADHSRFDSRDLRIEDEFSAGLASKLARKKSFDYLKHADDLDLRNESENEKNSFEGQEDNKVKDLSQEVERLKNRLKQMELVEEDLKNMESKNAELIEKYQQERNRSQALHDQVEQMKMQLNGCSSSNGNSAVTSTTKVLENGKAENEEIHVRSFRQEKPKLLNRSPAASEPVTSKYKSREASPQQRRETKQRNKDLCHSTESSPKTVRRTLSPAHNARKGMKTGASSTTSDNGTKDGKKDEKIGSASSSAVNESKKVSVLSRYPPAANDQKSWKPPVKQNDSDSNKSQTEKLSKYTGSDSESNNSDGSLLNSASAAIIASPEKGLTEPESLDQDNSSMLSLSKANGSYTAYRSHVSPSVLSDQGSDGHSSASETESIGSRRLAGEQNDPLMSSTSGRTSSKYTRYSRLQESYSDGSSKGPFSEEQRRPLTMEGDTQETTHTTSGIEVRRVCSPREALQSKAVIKQAIVEIDRKEVMSGGITEPLTTSGKPKISTKPVLTSKMTSSITFYPNDPSSSQTSSRSSSLSSEPPSKERHTSTSNIVIGPSSEHRGSISIPYEISIPKSEITLCQGETDADFSEPHSYLETAPVEATLLSQSSFSLQSSEASDLNNDIESGFESSSSGTTVTNWKSHHNHHSYDDSLPEMRNVTVRSTWRSRGAASVDESARALRQDGSEDEGESASTWRAYRATTVLDTPSNSSTVAKCGSKPSPVEVYMRRINNAAPSVHDLGRRNKKTPSPERAIAHEPVSAQQLQPRGRKHPMSADDRETTPSSWRRQPPGDVDLYDRSASRGAWSSRNRTADGSRSWSNRHLDN